MNVVHVKNFTAVVRRSDGALIEASYSARESGRRRKVGETPVFAMLFLAKGLLEDPDFDPEQELIKAGWTPPPEGGPQ